MNSPAPIFDALAKKHRLVRLPYSRKLGNVGKPPVYVFKATKTPTKEN